MHELMTKANKLMFKLDYMKGRISSKRREALETEVKILKDKVLVAATLEELGLDCQYDVFY